MPKLAAPAGQGAEDRERSPLQFGNLLGEQRTRTMRPTVREKLTWIGEASQHGFQHAIAAATRLQRLDIAKWLQKKQLQVASEALAARTTRRVVDMSADADTLPRGHIRFADEELQLDFEEGTDMAGGHDQSAN